MISETLLWFQSSPLVTASWVDWVDIGVLAWIIYRGLMFLRGTRALQSIVGLVVLGVGYIVSDWVGLTAVRWVLDHMFVWVVLVVIILFQEDIRRALARAGGTFWGRSARSSDAGMLEEVIKACFSLAHRKIGALIAIERTASLKPYLEGSRAMDSMVSTELLQSIFHPTSPIHDGAVVLGSGRLQAAGVFLPISLSKDLSRAYGTRHRAAIGLTESTDAIVLVVSEERGTVSLVQDGHVVPVADANDLRQRLQEGLELSQAQPALVGGEHA